MLTKFKRRTALSLFVLLLAGLFIGGHQPASAGLFPAPWDKLAHFTLYGIFSILISIILPNAPRLAWVLLPLSIGALDEFHQYFVPGREPGFDDLLADLAGAMIATFLTTWFQDKHARLPKD